MAPLGLLASRQIALFHPLMVSQPAQTHRGTEPSGCKGSLISPGVLGHALEEDGNGFSPRRGYCLWNIPDSAGRDSQEDAAVTLCPASPVSIQETQLALPGPSQRFQDNPHPPSPHPPKHSPPQPCWHSIASIRRNGRVALTCSTGLPDLRFPSLSVREWALPNTTPQGRS